MVAANELTRPVPRHMTRRSEHGVKEILSRSNLPGRLQVFRRYGVVCKRCGIEGTFFALERHTKGPTHPESGWHYNLYADVPGGGTRLMTVDHIIPRSKGGAKKHVANLQPMCDRCNCKKSNTMPDDGSGKFGGSKRARQRRRRHARLAARSSAKEDQNGAGEAASP